MRKEIQDKIKSSPDKEVNLNGLSITDSELKEVAEKIIKIKPEISSLYLDKNKISDVGALILKKSLLGLKNLELLDLQHNQIDEEGAKAIFSLLQKKPKLTIAMHGNKITDAGVMNKIANSIKKLKQ